LSRRVKAHARPSQVDMGQRVLKEYQEVERRQYKQRDRAVERAFEDAAPRFRDKGWTVTKEENR
jgi:hypothetical protein